MFQLRNRTLCNLKFIEYIGEIVDEQDNEVQLIKYNKEYFQNKFNEFIKEK